MDSKKIIRSCPFKKFSEYGDDHDRDCDRWSCAFFINETEECAFHAIGAIAARHNKDELERKREAQNPNIPVYATPEVLERLKKQHWVRVQRNSEETDE